MPNPENPGDKLKEVFITSHHHPDVYFTPQATVLRQGGIIYMRFPPSSGSTQALSYFEGGSYIKVPVDTSDKIVYYAPKTKSKFELLSVRKQKVVTSQNVSKRMKKY